MKAVLDDSESFEHEELAPLYLYSCGLYTSFPMIEGKALLLDRHLERLSSSSAEFFGLICGREQLLASLRRFLSINEGARTATIRLTVFPKDLNIGAPEKAATLSILVTGRQGSSVANKPLRLKTLRCDRPFAQYKVTNIAAALHARGAAHKAGYDDALFVSEGWINEGPTWNIFVVLGNRLVTPPLTGDILPGVMRRAMIESFGDRVEERPLRLEEVKNARAAFVTNAVIGAKAVASIDDALLATDHPAIGQASELVDRLPRQPIG